MRNKLVLEFWDRSKELNINNKKYKSYVENFFKDKLKQDVGKGDITTNSLISKNKKIKASVIARENGIIAGMEEVLLLLKQFKVKKYKKDGDKIKNNDKILEIYGNARKILNYERTLLNILQRMGGIATLTYETKRLVKNNCFIAGTRKTLFPLFDEKALSVGGALTHRLDLSSAILVKDSHLEILNDNIKKAIILASENKKTKYVEIEVKNGKEALKAADTIYNLKSNKIFAIMFDNMTPTVIKKTVIKINNIKKNNKNKNILFEASGGINQENIKEYSKTGVDIISLGILTHSAKTLNISLEIK
ncbi:MAG: carboxylating nicotinate-nucleotide diphosphorylase [Nanoarchaeota archaeon]|nr:carboxylating nicotinate-nucleotide diphosphorylase [Nanoarchaeota archaeon]